MSNYTELTADGSSGAVRCAGTLYQIEAEGTFGSGTVTPQKKSYSGTWIPLGDAMLSANGAINIQVPSGAEIRATLSGATTPSVKIHITRIR